MLSFDDGYASQVRDAEPALRRAGWPGVLNLTLANLAGLGGVARQCAAWSARAGRWTHTR